MQFALGEDTNLRRELGTRDADSSRRNTLLIAISIAFPLPLTAFLTYTLSPQLQDQNGLLYFLSTTVSIFILMSLATFPYFLLNLCFTSHSPLLLYQERIYPGFFEQTILGYTRKRDLKHTDIKIHKPHTKIGRRLGMHSAQITSSKHWVITLRMLTKSEVDLLMAYWNAANPEPTH